MVPQTFASVGIAVDLARSVEKDGWRARTELGAIISVKQCTWALCTYINVCKCRGLSPLCPET